MIEGHAKMAASIESAIRGLLRLWLCGFPEWSVTPIAAVFPAKVSLSFNKVGSLYWYTALVA